MPSSHSRAFRAASAAMPSLYLPFLRRREAWAAAQAACGGYAGPGRQLDDDDLQSRFRASVSAILESGRLPRGAQMEALGKHFRAVHIVALR